MQLGKLRIDVGRIRDAGAEVFAISKDNPAQAALMAREVAGAIPILSDPSMRVIHQYGMKSYQMQMAEMGYVVIDRRGTIRTRSVDRNFGQRADTIIETLKEEA